MKPEIRQLISNFNFENIGERYIEANICNVKVILDIESVERYNSVKEFIEGVVEEVKIICEKNIRKG